MKGMSTKQTFSVSIAFFLLAFLLRGVFSKPAGSRACAITNSSKHENGTDGSSHSTHRIKVAKLDFDNIATPFIVVLWVLLASFLKLVFHMTTRLSKIVPESCLIILLGATLGGILSVIEYEDIATLPFFTSRIFFLFLLPPIVLDAGYFLHTRVFFDNFGTILLFAVVGTIFNTFTVGLTLFACTDLDISLLQMLLFPVLLQPLILSAFLANRLLNDAVTVVLYRLFEALVSQENIKVQEVFVGVASFFVVSFGGLVIGIFWAFLTAFSTKFTDHVRVLEPIFVFSMSYMAYLTAELFHFSGIISIVTCAIVMKPYVDANISQKSRLPVKYFMKMASSLSETIIFMLLGAILFNRPLKFNVWFIFLTIVFISIYRCLGVVLLTWLANKIGRLNKLGKVEQFVMAYGGLRGAVAFSLAILIQEEHVPEKVMLETTTIVVVLFTVFIQDPTEKHFGDGTTIKPIVDFLKVKRAVKRKEIMLGEVNDKMLDHLLGGIQEVIQHRGHYYWKNLYQHVDVKYLRRWFMRHEVGVRAGDETLVMVYKKLAYREAMMSAEGGSVSISCSTELEDYESVDIDRRGSLALAPYVLENGESEKFKEVYNHAQLSYLLGRPENGVARRFSRNSILDETDTGDHALRIRRRSHTTVPQSTIISVKTALGEDGEKKEPSRRPHHKPGHKEGHNEGHHHAHKHGHKHHHKHTHHTHGADIHQQVHMKLSAIAETDTMDTPTQPLEQESPEEADETDEAMVALSSFPVSLAAPSELTSSLSDSAYQSHESLPRLADLEPSSPTMDAHFMEEMGELPVTFDILNDPRDNDEPPVTIDVHDDTDEPPPVTLDAPPAKDVGDIVM